MLFNEPIGFTKRLLSLFIMFYIIFYSVYQTSFNHKRNPMNTAVVESIEKITGNINILEVQLCKGVSHIDQ